MQPEIYSDGIGEITVSGSIVRVDLVSLSATERDANNNPKSVLRQRIIFSVEAFANSADVMQKALQGLVEAGVIRRNPSGQAAGMQGGASGTAGISKLGDESAQRTKVSPNFR
jgi:hypothetical protein